MPSDKQIAANRRNAEKSTGPKTAEGKEKSALNVVRHGLRAEHLVLFDETPDEFRAFHEDLRTAHAPADAAEAGLVERIAMAHWRLRRVWRAEAAAINDEALSSPSAISKSPNKANSPPPPRPDPPPQEGRE
jgi:hypothetical protein